MNDETVETFAPDGTAVEIPEPAYLDWVYEVANGMTYRGLLDWYENERH